MAEEHAFGPLLARVTDIVRGSGESDEKLLAVCQLLWDEVEHYHWVGFYIVGPTKQDLLLGPYVGQPSRHVNIPFGQGVCGMAAQKGRTLMVPDVSQVLNYLSCSLWVQSEMVVPIFKDGHMVAELDIDSHDLAAFTEQDKGFLEDVCAQVAGLFS